MNSYQLTLLIKNDLDEKTRKEVLDDVTKNFDKLTKEDLWGVRNLAYPIKHSEKAYFAHFEFEAEPAKIPSLDKMIKLNEDIMRYLLIGARDKSKKAKDSENKADVQKKDVVDDSTSQTKQETEDRIV